jgi:L1 cell adhesion molecule like protein
VNDQGNRTTPSYVAFTDSQRMIGDSAFNAAASNPTNTIYGKNNLLNFIITKILLNTILKNYSLCIKLGIFLSKLRFIP